MVLATAMVSLKFDGNIVTLIVESNAEVMFKVIFSFELTCNGLLLEPGDEGLSILAYALIKKNFQPPLPSPKK